MTTSKLNPPSQSTPLTPVGTFSKMNDPEPSRNSPLAAPRALSRAPSRRTISTVFLKASISSLSPAAIAAPTWYLLPPIVTAGFDTGPNTRMRAGFGNGPLFSTVASFRAYP